jgi:hypothetical protein
LFGVLILKRFSGGSRQRFYKLPIIIDTMTKKKKDDNSGIFIPAGLFLGIGIGLLTGQVAAFTMIGLGIGFFALAGAKVAGK